MIEKKEQCVRAAVAMAVVMSMVVLLAVTAFAEMTYVINDGDRQVIHKTGATEPAEVLEEAGLELSVGDLIVTEETFGGATITIHRAVEITVDYYGQITTCTAYEDETLGQALSRLELTCSESDVISLPLDTQIVHGLSLSIATVEVKEESFTVAIPYETVYVDDDDMEKGAQKVRTEGVDGVMNCTASVTYVNGVETSREVTSEEVAVEPVQKVVAVGTGKNVFKSAMGNVIIGDGTITLPSGEVLTFNRSATFKATAYTHTDAGCDTITATGTTVRWGTVAVDPRVIPYGTRMFIVTSDGSFVYGVGTAEDCGGGIKGNRLDLYFPSYSQCVQFGVRNCTVYFLG